jgi:hypothetical protein
MTKAIELLKNRLALRKEIYLLTDGQSIGWRHLADITKALGQVKDQIRAHVVLVGEHEERDLGVSELRVAGGLTPVRQPLRFEVRVTNYGRQPVDNVRVTLSVDADPPSDEFTLDTLPAGASKSVSLFAKLRTEGFHSVTARLAEDRLPADDKRTVAVRALKEVRVLLVDGEPGAEPRDSETFFLRNALAPVASADAPGFYIRPQTITAAELGGARFDDFDAVVLANVGEFSENAARALESYVRRGGGLMVFPGARLNPAFYNDTLAKKLNLLPATFGPARGQAEQEEKFFTLSDKDLDHPIVSIWNDPASGRLGAARFFRACELVPVAGVRSEKGSEGAREPSTSLPHSPTPPPQTQGEPQVILRFTDGPPAAMERAHGLGRVVQFSSTADTAWNDLPVRLVWVPLVHRTLGALVQRQDEGLNIRVGDKFVRQASADLLGKDALVLKPRQTDVVRDLRRIEMVGGWPAFQYDQTDFAGVYELSVAEPPVALRFAAQADPTESLLDEMSAEQKKMLGAVAHVVEWAPNFSLKAQVERERSGYEFWLPLLLAALGVAVLETALAQWFSRSK